MLWDLHRFIVSMKQMKDVGLLSSGDNNQYTDEGHQHAGWLNKNLCKPCVFDVTTLWTIGNSLRQSQQKYILVCLAKCLQRETLLHFTRRQCDSPKPFASQSLWVWTLGLGPNESLVFSIPDIRLYVQPCSLLQCKNVFQRLTVFWSTHRSSKSTWAKQWTQ